MTSAAILKNFCSIPLDPRIVIIGAGPCGIGAAVRLTELGYKKWSLYEATKRWGGLSASVRDQQGFTWDQGGHVVFSHYQYFDDLCSKLGPESYNDLKRKCVLFMREGDYIIDYPLQNHLHQLPESEQLSCLTGLLTAHWNALKEQNIEGKDDGSQSTTDKQKLQSEGLCRTYNFADWGKKVLGEGIVKIFLRPYNEKLWSIPLEEMSSTWLGERVAVPDFKKVLDKFESAGVSDDWGPNSVFKYPSVGGTGAIWNTVSTRLPAANIHLGTKVISIDGVQRTVTLDDGTVAEFDVLINTMPLPELAKNLKFCSEFDSRIAHAGVSKLKFSHVLIIGFGIKGIPPEVLQRFQWSYFPENDAPMFRVTVLSNYACTMCPTSEYYSLLCEVAFSDWKPQQQSNASIVAEVEVALRRYSLIADDGIIESTFVKYLHYGYPTPTLDRDSNLDMIQSTLAKCGILSRGRFGGWKYEVANMDHSVMQGTEAVDFILSEALEISLPFKEQKTYFDPDYSNNRANRSNIPLTNIQNFLPILNT